LTPHTCDISVEQTSSKVQEQESRNMLEAGFNDNQKG
jgi:hypothetical protein